MNRLISYLILALAAFSLLSCEIDPLQPVGAEWGEEIKFKTEWYKATVFTPTKSASDTAIDTKPKRLFLGMVDSDSLFLSISESPVPETSSPATKGGSQPESIFLTTFKDQEDTPYMTDLELTSGDNWQNYNPKTYWPVNYTYLHFFAHSYNVGENVITPQYSTEGGVFSASFNFTTPKSEDKNDAAVQPDIIFAITPEAQESKGPVDLSFVHLLSKVRFQPGAIGNSGFKIDSLTVTLHNIIHEGSCFLKDPLSKENIGNINWNLDTDTTHFTQTFTAGDESFMLIPQTLTDNTTFSISFKVGKKVHRFNSLSLKNMSTKWEPNKMYTYSITSGGYVESTMEEQQVMPFQLSPISIQNTGWTTSRVRVSIFGYWYLTDPATQTEKVVGKWNINDERIGEMSIAEDWNYYWEQRSDGFYYYKYSLSPAQFVAVPLFNSYQLVQTAGPASGSQLKIKVSVQSIDENDAATYWPAD